MSYPMALPARYALSRSYYTRTMIKIIALNDSRQQKSNAPGDLKKPTIGSHMGC
jgi:hypothetical protein